MNIEVDDLCSESTACKRSYIFSLLQVRSLSYYTVYVNYTLVVFFILVEVYTLWVPSTLIDNVRCCYQVVCAAVAVTVQYLFLSAFFLMLVQAVALLVKLKTVLEARSRMATYCILGWGQFIMSYFFPPGCRSISKTFENALSDTI